MNWYSTLLLQRSNTDEGSSWKGRFSWVEKRGKLLLLFWRFCLHVLRLLFLLNLLAPAILWSALFWISFHWGTRRTSWDYYWLTRLQKSTSLPTRGRWLDSTRLLSTWHVVARIVASGGSALYGLIKYKKDVRWTFMMRVILWWESNVWEKAMMYKWQTNQLTHTHTRTDALYWWLLFVSCCWVHTSNIMHVYYRLSPPPAESQQYSHHSSSVAFIYHSFPCPSRWRRRRRKNLIGNIHRRLKGSPNIRLQILLF